MKIKIEFIVDVDPEQWMELQACETKAEVRDDVKQWAKGTVMEALADEGVLVR